jgi:hypothetical protein
MKWHMPSAWCFFGFAGVTMQAQRYVQERTLLRDIEHSYSAALRRQP